MSYVVPPLHVVERGIGGEGNRRGVAPHPPAARTSEGRPLVAALKVVVVHLSQLLDVGLRNPHIPGAHILTHVAAEYPVAQLRRLRGSECAVVFDREIGNAGARVEIAWPRERLGGTRIKTAAARAAAIGFERQIRL